MHEQHSSLLEQLTFDPQGLLPCIAQDIDSGEVLMLAYMNAEAVDNTLRTGKAHYYSRSRAKQWMKGSPPGMCSTCVKSVTIVTAIPCYSR